MMQWDDLGHVQADNTKDPDSLESIRFGFVAGEGLLGNVLIAGFKMASIANDYGYSNSEDDGEKWEQARIAFYQALKAIEVAAIQLGKDSDAPMA